LEISIPTICRFTGNFNSDNLPICRKFQFRQFAALQEISIPAVCRFAGIQENLDFDNLPECGIFINTPRSHYTDN
ncbi:hypothetical protein, partial [Salmonella sp. hn-h2]|uniref:hypothetical protein n=1 Tax=Salmonella sp. hn-h2 TaxID=2582611 RepID=UPI001F1ACD15